MLESLQCRKTVSVFFLTMESSRHGHKKVVFWALNKLTVKMIIIRQNHKQSYQRNNWTDHAFSVMATE